MGNGIPPGVVEILRIVITLAGIIAFAGMFGWGICRVWTRNTKPETDAFVYVATALAALVGGIVAVGFGQQPPHQVGQTTSHAFNSLSALGALVLPATDFDWEAFLGGAYAFVYVAFGIAAIITWVVGPINPTPPLIKNLATTFLGMAIPIISSFFAAKP